MYQKPIVERVLPVPFTEDEILSFKSALAFHTAEFLRIEKDKKEETKILNLNIKDCKDSIKDLSKKIQDGFEEKSVACRGEFDHIRGLVLIIRIDTDEVVEEREMTEGERQMELQFANNNPAEAQDRFKE